MSTGIDRNGWPGVATGERVRYRVHGLHPRDSYVTTGTVTAILPDCNGNPGRVVEIDGRETRAADHVALASPEARRTA